MIILLNKIAVLAIDVSSPIGLRWISTKDQRLYKGWISLVLYVSNLPFPLDLRLTDEIGVRWAYHNQDLASLTVSAEPTMGSPSP